MNSVLDRIVAAHRRAAAADTRTLDELERAALAGRPVRPFRAALVTPGIGVIAEIKRRSPSKGDLAPDLVPAVLAKAYADGGADCLSVLTDVEFFGGAPDDLAEARNAVDLPILRKDFTVSEADVYEAELSALRLLAHQLDMAALVEVHDDDELQRAVDAGVKLVGVNQRDLRTFEVDIGRAERLAEAMPPGIVKVAESGIRDADDVSRLAACGYDAILVGESLVTSADPTAAVRILKGTP